MDVKGRKTKQTNTKSQIFTLEQSSEEELAATSELAAAEELAATPELAAELAALELEPA